MLVRSHILSFVLVILTALMMPLLPGGAVAAPLDQGLPPPRGPLTQGPPLPGPLPQGPPQGPIQALPPPGAPGAPFQGLPQGPVALPPPVAPLVRDFMPADPLPPPGVRELAQRPAAPQDAVSQALQPLREAYLLLQERHVDPQLPGNLILAAQNGLTLALAEQGITAPDPSTFGSTPPLVERQSNWQWLTQRFRAIVAQYGDRVSARELAFAAATAMANSLDDGHTQFMVPKEYDEHRAWTRGDTRYGGVGMRLRGPEPTVAHVFPDSPAAQGGVQVGDVILAVDGELVLGLRVDEIVQRVRGPEGSTVRLRMRRAGTGREQEFSLNRAQVNLPFVESRVEGDLGYIALRGFPEPSIVDQVERAMQSLQAQGVRGLVFDLRGNSGGRLDVGTRLLGRFVSDGVVYQMVDRQGRGETTRLRGAQPVLSVPLAVLVDEGTASMGELFAATIQERGAGRVIGATTAGSVSASVVVGLSEGAALQLTVERLLTAQGRALDKVGVTPDQAVPLAIADIQAGRDPQLDAATTYLRTMATTNAGAPRAAR